jgi:hypothetical protein
MKVNRHSFLSDPEDEEDKENGLILLARSGLLVDTFPRALVNPTAAAPEENFYIYGDPAYGLSKYIVTGFGKNNQTAQMAVFNQRMSAVRECVEWEGVRVGR